MELNPYLMFNGQCAAAFEFYARCLGGRIEAMIPHRGSPAEGHVSPEWLDKILHARLVAGDAVLMASDSPPEHREEMRGFSVSLSIDDPREAERIFEALKEDGTVRMPMGETFWALRFGMLVDRFGVPWMINCSRPG